PPGHLIVDTAGRIIATSDDAERWLSTLEPSGRVPSVVASLAAAIARRPYAHATVTGTEGPITLHASVSKGLDDAIGIVIERPRPVLLASAIATAHGLTAREAEVVSLVMQGLSTRQIAVELGISEYTVQDHLKSVFGKVGVATRGELTFELFIRHYLPPTLADSTPGPYGYFLDPPTLADP
ncbi:MAG: helix-turn-helix transcriptional regulator, partial [Acidimicrobiia bacterium]|nr:helix-turn-helix transcriptional regulator [Acidimicrobiia bacterium]